MELTAGTRVGPYEIQRAIGAGGMGVVYRALDGRLGRQVAIKVLPAAVRGDDERLRRFEQEARTIGGLNHPNLVTLHDVGHHDGAPYLVTELLEGLSLRQRIVEGAVPLRDIVHIATEIARGLAAAHGAGVVHRDIKPDNVFVTSDGRVKILDFGIAKLKRDDDAASKGDLGSAPTLGTAATGTGVVIGTPGYMAPEQLAGGAVDARTDLFALGVVIYELVTRKRPFAAATGIEESYAIMKAPPTALPPSAPPALARIVLRCLEKRPEARFQSAADLAFALDALDEVSTGRISEPSLADAQTLPAGTPAFTPPAVTVPPAATTAAMRPGMALSTKLMIAGWTIVAMVLTAGVVWRLSKSNSVKAELPPPATTVWPSLVEGGPSYKRVTYHSQSKWFARFGDDGRSVLYSMRQPDEWQVVRSEIAQPSMIPLGVDGRLLDVSPNGELLVRLPAKNAPAGILAQVKPGGAAPRRLGEQIEEAAWGPDGTIAVIRRDDRGTHLEYPIGTTIADAEHGELSLLAVARDGAQIALVEQLSPPDSRGRVVIVDNTGKQLAASGEYNGIEGIAWPRDGHEVWFSSENTIRALDRDRHERVVLRGQLRLQLRDIDDGGRILVAPTDARFHMFARASAGAAKEISWNDASSIKAVSTDGDTLAFLQTTGLEENRDGYAAYVRKGNEMPIRIGNAFGLALVPDGKSVLMLCGDGARLRVVSIESAAVKTLRTGTLSRFDFTDTPAVSADGTFAIVRAAVGAGPMQLVKIDLAGTIDPVAIGPTSVPHGHHPITPDGDWVALAGDHGVRLVSTAKHEDVVLEDANAEEPLRYAADGTALFVVNQHSWPRVIRRIDLGTSKATDWMTIDDPTKPRQFDVEISGDGKRVVYSLSDETSDLYVIEPAAK